MGVQTITEEHFFRHQQLILQLARLRVWRRKHRKLIQTLAEKEGQLLKIGGRTTQPNLAVTL